ncbi:arginine--tRNA ligase [Oribacterium sp. HCP28S3_H8]|uniref:arginine--tRNA ligase n=1 Tax=Oribacterium sp. HCP28S3_H8 TaxID=3438945 RepID=UPI003F88B282
MNTIQNIISDAVKTGFALAGYDRELGRVSISNRPDLCEYQSNGAMAGAKKYHQKPMDIANAVVSHLVDMKYEEVQIFSRAEAVMPGFINLNLSGELLGMYLNDMNHDPAMGLEQNKTPKTIIVDYGGANVAKPLHVGHLRSAVIGEAIKRMAAKMGNKVIGDVHLGDWGLQMGLIIAELEDRGKLGEDFTISELEEIYPYASQKAKEKDDNGNLVNAAFAERAHEATRKLQQGDPVYHKVWEQIMRVSVADLKKNYDNLDVHFDLWKGESDAEPYIPGLIRELEDKGLAYESQGALVVDITEPSDPKELPPCMIRKSDGASLYATSDLGTIIEREKLYHPDAYIYVADSRQSLHYTQFFRVARKAGFVKPETGLTFIGFGTMNGKDGKPFKTREGGVLRLETLIRETNDKVLERIRESRGEDMSGAEAEANAKIIGLAALKYGDLSNQATKDYVFDLDKFTSFEGNTGPYILYTIVRIGSILRKYAEAAGLSYADTESFVREHAGDFRILPMEDKSGRDLETLLARYQDELCNAWTELAPHKICTYIYEISNSFNSFYHNVKILAEEDTAKKQSYLAVLMLTWRILTSCIHVLGFNAPERM